MMAMMMMTWSDDDQWSVMMNWEHDDDDAMVMT